MSLYFPILPIPSIVYVEEMGFQTLQSTSQFDDGLTEQRRNKSDQPKKSFSLKYNALSRIELDRLWNFYQLCKGSFRAFYYQAIDETQIGSLLPYDQVKVWVPLHEGTGTKLDDLHGYLYPTYSCKFAEDKMSKEYLAWTCINTGLKLVQESPLSFTNNYGTLSGTYTWIQLADGTVCPSFDGASGHCSFGDAADLDIGTGDFSLAIGVYPNVLAAAKPIITKKADNLLGTDGWALLLNANGSMDFYFADGATLKTISSAAGALVVTTWHVVTVTMDRDGNGQIYRNNIASGAAVDISAANGNADSTTAAYIARQSAVYGNIAARNFMFAKKVWTAAERTKIWDHWSSALGI